MRETVRERRQQWKQRSGRACAGMLIGDEGAEERDRRPQKWIPERGRRLGVVVWLAAAPGQASTVAHGSRRWRRKREATVLGNRGEIACTWASRRMEELTIVVGRGGEEPRRSDDMSPWRRR